jgi:hypothetical protein
MRGRSTEARLTHLEKKVHKLAKNDEVLFENDMLLAVKVKELEHSVASIIGHGMSSHTGMRKRRHLKSVG